MYCTYCNAARPENEAPCPYCGAPSPLWGRFQGSSRAGSEPTSSSWGAQAASQWSAPGVQLSFDQPSANQGAQFWTHSPQPEEMQAQPQSWSFSPEQQSWSPSPAAPQPAPAQQASPPSLLPVPYEGGTQIQPSAMQWQAQQMMQVQTLEQMLPDLPVEEGTLYVPPMYTRPRPIIPKYRAISGLVSFIIVCLLLCTGATYYAEASGKLAQLGRNFTGAPPPSITPPSSTPIPDPPDTIDKGPASDIIPSATTTSRVDPQSRIPLQPQKIFAVDQTFYVTYSVQRPRQSGTVTIKWYMDKQFYRSLQSPVIKAGATINGDAPMMYAVPASGMAEIYWNDQLALRVYFAVR